MRLRGLSQSHLRFQSRWELTQAQLRFLSHASLLDSLPKGRRLIICWQRLQLRRIYLLRLIGLRERVEPSSEGTRRVPSQRPYRVASVGYLSCKVRGASLYFIHCDVVCVMFKEAIRRRERDDNIPLPILACSRECLKPYNNTHHRIQGENCQTLTKLYEYTF